MRPKSPVLQHINKQNLNTLKIITRISLSQLWVLGHFQILKSLSDYVAIFFPSLSQKSSQGKVLETALNQHFSSSASGVLPDQLRLPTGVRGQEMEVTA